MDSYSKVFLVPGHTVHKGLACFRLRACGHVLLGASVLFGITIPIPCSIQRADTGLGSIAAVFGFKGLGPVGFGV